MATGNKRFLGLSYLKQSSFTMTADRIIILILAISYTTAYNAVLVLEEKVMEFCITHIKDIGNKEVNRS